jgi:hypothetical protein
MLHIPTPTTIASASVSRPVTGRYLANNHLPPRCRALLAGDLVTGKAHLITPTIAQAAMLTRVSVPHAAAGKAIVYSQPHKRSGVESGECSLLAAANRARTMSEILVKAWANASPDERREFCRAAGIEPVWTALTAAIG